MKKTTSAHRDAGELAFRKQYLYPVIAQDLQALALQSALNTMAITEDTHKLIGKIKDFDALFVQANFARQLNEEIEQSQKKKAAPGTWPYPTC